MKPVVVQVLTIILFSSLIGLFTAYRSGYFTPEKPVSDIDQLLSEPFLQETKDTVIYLNNQVLDKALLELASSSKSLTATDQTVLAKALEKALSQEEIASTPSLNWQPSLLKTQVSDVQNVMISSSKVIISTDKSFLASRLKTTFTKDWRRIFQMILSQNDSVKFNKDQRLVNPTNFSSKHILPAEWILPSPIQLPSETYIKDNLISTSKSIVVTDRADLADSLKRLILLNNFEKKLDTLKRKNN